MDFSAFAKATADKQDKIVNFGRLEKVAK